MEFDPARRSEMVDLPYRKAAGVPAGEARKRLEAVHEFLKRGGVDEYYTFVRENYGPGDYGHEVKAHDLLKAYLRAIEAESIPSEPAFDWLERKTR